MSRLQALAARGCRLVVVTNQRGVARGHMSTADLDAIHEKMNADLARDGVILAGVYACPHEVGTCDCRKPGIGLFSRAMQDRPEIQVSTSAVVGDSIGDMQAANRLGAAAYLIADEARRSQVLEGASRQGVRVDASFGSLSALVADGFGIR
jgi:D-glycero-D-manno-heptose 1,7-bisphosphate phosphatase